MRRKKIPGIRSSQTTEAYVMLIPMLLGLAFISIGTIVGVIGLSFTDYTLDWPPNFVGLDNYKALFSYKLFPKILWNSIWYVVLVAVPSVVLSLALALLLDRKLRGISVFRAIFFWPVVASMTAVSLIWSFMLNSNFGLVNYMLNAVGVQGPKWLSDTKWVIVSFAFIFLWKTVGYYMTIMLGGLQNIPEELYESAKLDGANYLQRTRHITLPMISPTLFLVLVMVIISGFQVFDQILVISKDGGPNYSTLTLSFYIYQNAFNYGKMGYASAAGTVLFLIVVGFSVIQFKLQNKWVHYE